MPPAQTPPRESAPQRAKRCAMSNTPRAGHWLTKRVEAHEGRDDGEERDAEHESLRTEHRARASAATNSAAVANTITVQISPASASAMFVSQE